MGESHINWSLRPGWLTPLVAASAVAWPIAGLAQSSPPEPTTVEAVTVTGEVEAVRSDIDRQSYDVTHDLQGANGSIADVLRNIPSVEVNLQGAVTVRGDSNIVIMLDGRPSAEFRGANAAAALQQLSASQIERVELITNPSAAFSPEGSAVINLISRKGRREGPSGQIRATLSERGQYSLGLTGTFNSEKLAITGDVGFGYRGDDLLSDETRLSFDPASGLPIIAVGQGRIRARTRWPNGRVTVRYDLSEATQLTAGLRLSQDTTVGLITQRFDITGPGAGGVGLTERQDNWVEGSDSLGLTAGYTRKFSGDAHDLTIDLRHETLDRRSEEHYLYLSGAPASGPFELYVRTPASTSQGMKAEYKRPLANQAKLVIGGQLDADDSTFDNLIARGADLDSAIPDPLLSGRFTYDQTVAAAYATYQRPFGKLSILAGLRLEEVWLNLADPDKGLNEDSRYFEAYPSLHSSYAVSETKKATLSYSRRVQRPGAFDLNPGQSLNGDLITQRGNPRLKPQFTDAFEGAFEYRKDKTSYRSTLYLRQSDNAFTNIYSVNPDGSPLITRDNLGKLQNIGLELAASAPLSPTLKYNLSANLYRREMTTASPSPSAATTRALSTVQGRASLEWRATPDDTIQIAAIATGKALLAQGTIEPYVYWNVGYRRKVNDQVSAVLTVSDVFKIQQNRLQIDTPEFVQTQYLRGQTRLISLGLTYALGARKAAAEPEFEF